MSFKPFRDYSEHDVLNLFKLNTATGAKGTPVVIDGSGWKTDVLLPRVQSNLAAGYLNGNIYSPRWEIIPAVRAAVSGEKPLGLTLYDTRENNYLGYPLLYDKQRRDELQAVVSGQAVPIVCKGLFHLGPFPTGGLQPAANRYIAVAVNGDYGVLSSNTGPTGQISGISVPGAALPVFGKFLGSPDADGYALVQLNCY